MSLAGALLLAAVAAPPPAAGAAQEIVVIGRRLRDWKGGVQSRDGVVSCRTHRSTGDAAIDAIGCNALIACMAPAAPAIQSIAKSDLPRAERQRRMDALARAAIPCLTRQREDGIAELARRRFP